MTERPHVYALLDIQVPDVQDINRLEKLAKSNGLCLLCCVLGCFYGCIIV